jgi:hypothetical protein
MHGRDPVTRSQKSFVAWLLLVLLVNLPLVHGSWTDPGAVSPALVVFTLGADALVVAVGLLLWRAGPPRRPPLQAVALEDVARCPPGTALERIALETYLIRGEITEIEADRLVLDVGGRSVVVHLDGHRNPVGYQQPAQVRVRLV